MLERKKNERKNTLHLPSEKEKNNKEKNST